NSALTLFSPSRNHAEQRLRAIKDTGGDPGTAGITAPPPTPTSPAASAGEPVADAEILDPVPGPTVEALWNRIRSHIIENFTGRVCINPRTCYMPYSRRSSRPYPMTYRRVLHLPQTY